MREQGGELEPELAEVLSEALSLAESGRPGDALDLLLKAEPDYPEEPALLCALGVVCQQVGADGMAMDFFRRCLDQEPTDPDILVTAGTALAGGGDPIAEPALRLAVVTAPNHAPARLHFGRLLVRSGLVEQGLEELREARRLNEEDPLVHRELGLGLLVAARSDEAIAALEEALGLEGNDADTRLLLGLALLQNGEVEPAAEVMHPVATALAEEGDVQLLLALTFAAAGWKDEAWLALTRAGAPTSTVHSSSVLEVEEAFEDGADAVRALLLDEVAPSALRDRLFAL